MFSLVMDNKSSLQDLLDDQIGMPWSRFRVLRRLEHADRTQREIAGRMGIDAPAASVIVADLVNRGYVIRAQHPTDRRCKVVRITDSGRALLDQIRDLDVVPTTTAPLTAAERKELARLVEKMRQGAEK